MIKFNKQQMAANIRALASQKNVKIGEIENESGVSQGYVSRMQKTEDNSSSAVMDLLLCASRRLNVSIEALLDGDINSFTPNEQYLFAFFEKMLHDTRNNKLTWTKETNRQIEKKNSEFPDLLRGEDYHPDFGPLPCYKSLFKESNGIGQNGGVFTEIYGKKLIIVQIERDFNSDDIGYEIYLYSSELDEIEKVTDIYEDYHLFNSVQRLFQEASLSIHQIKILPSVRSTIDGFMKNKDPNLEEDDGLSF